MNFDDWSREELLTLCKIQREALFDLAAIRGGFDDDTHLKTGEFAKVLTKILSLTKAEVMERMK